MSQDRAQFFKVNIQSGAVRMLWLLYFLDFNFKCEIADVREWIRIRVDGQIRFEYPTCGRGHFWIRKEQFADSKYPDTCGRGLII